MGADVDSANVIEAIDAHCKGLEDATVLYFFIDGSEQRPFDIGSLYKTFAGQLASRRSDLSYTLRHFANLWRSHGNGGHRLQDGLRHYLREEFAHLGHIYLVIDGVDECQESVGIDALMNLLKSLRNDANQRLHILISSRDLEVIRQNVAAVQARRIVMQDEPLQSDIQRTVRSKLSDNPQFARWPTAIKSEIETSLSAQAQDS